MSKRIHTIGCWITLINSWSRWHQMKRKAVSEPVHVISYWFTCFLWNNVHRWTIHNKSRNVINQENRFDFDFMLILKLLRGHTFPYKHILIYSIVQDVTLFEGEHLLLERAGLGNNRCFHGARGIWDLQ